MIYLLDLPIEDELEQERMRAAEEATANGGLQSDSEDGDSGSDTSNSSVPDRARGKFRRLDKIPARHKHYYQASSFAYPSASIAWKLTGMLVLLLLLLLFSTSLLIDLMQGSRVSGELAWWTAIALSDAYQHDRLSKERYCEMIGEVRKKLCSKV